MRGPFCCRYALPRDLVLCQQLQIGRMRVLSSPKVLASAEQIGQKITNMYLEPNKTFFELRDMINKNAIDILGDFGESCREEFRSPRMETA